MTNLLDFIFPKRCVVCKKFDSYLCANCFSFLSFDAKNLCLVCRKPSFQSFTHPNCKNRLSIDGSFSTLSYNKTVKKLIYNFKYSPYVRDLSSFITDLVYENLIQNEEFNLLLKRNKWIIAPIPLSSGKFKKRGYNQSEILSIELSKKLEIEKMDILKRVKNTRSQVGLSLKERKENIRDAFLVIKDIKSKNIFLVDDVVTTGSTLLEATKVLKKSGAGKVFAITLARD